jgi:23S rRNA (cytosine1962-C5)-methyltransferase
MPPVQPTSVPPCVLHEDEHLLVVNKPAGWNTHAPATYAGEGIYDWLKHREPRWAKLAIIHRLDKETSGVLVFGKTPLANRSLTEQFAGRAVRKKYLLLSDRAPKQREFTAKSKIARAGERYVSGVHGEAAETKFLVAADVRRLKLRKPGNTARESYQNEPPDVGCYEWMAEPLTGRTHQIRVHAAEHGFPILGDTLYGGTLFPRVCLHAAELSFQHPATGEPVTFEAAADFEAEASAALRAAGIEPAATNAFRAIHGASDGWPGWYVERLGDFLLSQSERELTSPQRDYLAGVSSHGTGVYHKVLNRQVRRTSVTAASPVLVQGSPAPDAFTIRENGVKFELSFREGYSVGLFLDQRDNRRRLLTGHVAADFSLFNSELGTRNSELWVLNTFAYTCGFSVCAALGGARTTSLDLSKKYLEWGKRNFAHNQVDPAAHDFIYGDTFDWLKRLAKKGRAFDVVLLDPPTFSQSKESGVFRAGKDYGRLVTAALPVLKPGGVLFASTNAAELLPETFLAQIQTAVAGAHRKIIQQHYVPQPPDFPISRAEPAYLKTVWLRVS